MRDAILKTVLPIIVTLLTSVGAFSFQITYERGKAQNNMSNLAVSLIKSQQAKAQEDLGKFVVTFNRACSK